MKKGLDKFLPEELTIFFKKKIYITNRHIKYCPNDRTRLPDGIVGKVTIKNTEEYSECTCCPTCSCHIIRKPSQKRISKIEKTSKPTCSCFDDINIDYRFDEFEKQKQSYSF